MDRYDAHEIEPKWQAVWEAERAFYVDDPEPVSLLAEVPPLSLLQETAASRQQATATRAMRVRGTAGSSRQFSRRRTSPGATVGALETGGGAP